MALQAVHDAEIKLGDAVSVHGMGAIGLMAIQMCLLEGIQNVFAVDPDPRRRALAVEVRGHGRARPDRRTSPSACRSGTATDGRGVDVAIEVSGSDRGLQGALGAAGLSATVVAAGFYQGGAAHVHLGEEFHHNRLSLIASIGGWGTPNRHAPLWDRRRVLDVATRLLYTDRVSVAGLLDRSVPFDQAPGGVRAGSTSTRRSAVKVALRTSGGCVVTDRPVGVGLVGYGMSGSSLHGPLITAEPRLALRGVATLEPDQVRDLPGVPVLPTVAALLDDPAVELVVVAVQNAAHHDVARTALEAGRHVVVDKPFTLTTEQADDLIRLAEDRGLRLSVFHQRRWDADHLTIRRCVEAGLLGTVTTYIARYDRFRLGTPARWTDEDRPGAGVLYDLGGAPDRPGAAAVRHPADGLGRPVDAAPRRGRRRLRPPRPRLRHAARAAARRLAGPGARAAVRGARGPRVVRQGRHGRADRRDAGRGPAGRSGLGRRRRLGTC